MSKVNIKQQVLKTGATGLCVRGQWKWFCSTDDSLHTPCTRQVNSLAKAGKVDLTYYSGGNASCWPMESK